MEKKKTTPTSTKRNKKLVKKVLIVTEMSYTVLGQ